MQTRLYEAGDAGALLRFFDREDQGFCFCRYWSFAGPNDDWIASDPTDNRQAATREQGRMGIVASDGDAVVGWLRLARTDEVPKLRALGLEDGLVAGAASVLCMSVASEHRGRGLARWMLERAIEELPARGFTELRAYPRPEDAAQPGRVWTGPRALYERCGFSFVREAEPRCTMRRPLSAPAG